MLHFLKCPVEMFTLFSVIHGGYSMGTHWVSLLIFLLKKIVEISMPCKALATGFMGIGPMHGIEHGPPHSSKAQPP